MHHSSFEREPKWLLVLVFMIELLWGIAELETSTNWINYTVDASVNRFQLNQGPNKAYALIQNGWNKSIHDLPVLRVTVGWYPFNCLVDRTSFL